MAMENASVRELESRLINTLNESEVAIDVKRLIVQNIYHQVKAQADAVITQEINNNNKGDEDEQSISEIELC